MVLNKLEALFRQLIRVVDPKDMRRLSCNPNIQAGPIVEGLVEGIVFRIEHLPFTDRVAEITITTLNHVICLGVDLKDGSIQSIHGNDVEKLNFDQVERYVKDVMTHDYGRDLYDEDHATYADKLIIKATELTIRDVLKRQIFDTNPNPNGGQPVGVDLRFDTKHHFLTLTTECEEFQWRFNFPPIRAPWNIMARLGLFESILKDTEREVRWNEIKRKYHLLRPNLKLGDTNYQVLPTIARAVLGLTEDMHARLAYMETVDEGFSIPTEIVEDDELEDFLNTIPALDESYFYPVPTTVYPLVKYLCSLRNFSIFHHSDWSLREITGTVFAIEFEGKPMVSFKVSYSGYIEIYGEHFTDANIKQAFAMLPALCHYHQELLKK